ncbi:hypothetical protein T210_0138785, partial [Burkholderia pseudomallei MSHR6137]
MAQLPEDKPVSRARRAIAAGLALLPVVAFARKTAAKPVVQVWKTPTCGCCEDWLSHLKNNGFDVAVHNVEDTSDVRQQAGMPERFASCHTG